MAFKFRKQNPGSGGARPGAGRRPDISAEERLLIAEACERLYEKYRLKQADTAWCEDLLSHWLAHRSGDEHQIWRDVLQLPGLDLTQRRFLVDFAANPENHYDANGGLTFEVRRYYKGLCVLADTAKPPHRRPDRDYRLPRREVARTRSRVLETIKTRLLVPTLATQVVPGRTLDVSESFVSACWNAYGLKAIHKKRTRL